MVKIYCQNCGKEINSNICKECGAVSGSGNNFCSNCGAQLNDGADFCPVCDTEIVQKKKVMGRKSKKLAFVLALLFGGLGAHSYYLGYKQKAFFQLLVSLCTYKFFCAGGIIWGFFDAYKIYIGVINQDVEGNPLN